jgi:TRAP-type C4-dicarboxylate transport system permease small subunit
VSFKIFGDKLLFTKLILHFHRQKDQVVELNENDEEEKQEKSREFQVLLSLAGFFISVVLIWWGWIILTRFWIYSDSKILPKFIFNLFYYICLYSVLGIGIVFNITSINLLLFDEVVS